MNLIEKNISELVDAEYNPRQLTEKEFKDLQNSIQTFGFVEPIVINSHTGRENVIVGGHQRLRIAKEIGLKSVPCVAVDLSINSERELNVRLNKNSGKWDWDKLANEFDMAELIDWGFDASDFDVSQSFINEVSDISLLEENDNFSLSFNIRCNDNNELDTLKRIFKTGDPRISFEKAEELLCQLP